jgi:hypothetical protein
MGYSCCREAEHFGDGRGQKQGEQGWDKRVADKSSQPCTGARQQPFPSSPCPNALATAELCCQRCCAAAAAS